MRLWIRIVMVVSVLIAVLSSILLLNITAPNPTHRRYSSESPITKHATTAAIGLSGEQILSSDLGIPRNDLPTERKCFCNSSDHANPNTSECSSCLAQVELTSQFRRPDFVTADFIGESKNAKGLMYERRDFAQIADFVMAARLMSRPLWVYVRVDTRVDAEYIEMVRSTGGDVVFYFTTPDYKDPIDELALTLLIAAIGVFAVSLVLELGMRRWAQADSKSKQPSKRGPNPLETSSMRKARRTTEATENYMTRATDRTWTDIDRDTARGDQPSAPDDQL